MTDKVAQIAAKLTEAQRAAFVEMDLHAMSPQEYHETRDLGLTEQIKGRLMPSLTPLGLAVRAHLEQAR